MGINRIATGGGEGFGPPDDGGGHAAGHPHAEGARHADGAEVSALASALGALQQLQRGEPARFQQVIAAVAAALRDRAGGAAAPRARQLERLAARLEQAARDGDLAPVLLPTTAEGTGDHSPHALQAYRAQPPWPGAARGAEGPPLELAELIQAALRRRGRP
jgi:hypothetical protein